MSREEFLDSSPREFDSFTERLNLRREEERYSVAWIVASIYNSVCDYEKRPEGFAPEDFLGKPRPVNRELAEWAKEMDGKKWGDKPVPNPEHDEMADAFLTQVRASFNPDKLKFVKKEPDGEQHTR